MHPVRPLLIVLAASLAAGVAAAHGIRDPRVLVVVAGKESIEFRLNETFDPGDSELWRRRFDGDESGTLDDSERSDLTSFLAVRATHNLAVEVDGSRRKLATESRVLRGVGESVSSKGSLSLDVALRAPAEAATGKTVTVVVRDHRGDDHAVKAAVLGSGVTLQFASQGQLEAGRGVVTGIVLDRKHSLTLKYASPKASPAKK